MKRLPIRPEWIVGAFLIAAIVVVYWHVYDFDFVNYDDTSYVTDNIHVQSGLSSQSISWAFTTMHASNWHPLTWLSHMLDVQIFGLKPGWHHLVNVLFHILNTILLFLILRLMTNALWPGAFVAALFAFHPLHVESVAWVAERKDVLSTFFWIMTMGAYTYYAKNPNAKKYLVTFLLFALGLMAKPMLVTLPFALLLLDYWPLNRFRAQTSDNLNQKPPSPSPDFKKQKRRSRKSAAAGSPKTGINEPSRSRQSVLFHLVQEKIPFFLLSILSSIVTVYAQRDAVESLAVIPLSARIANAFVSYVSYIEKMIWPENLTILYPHPGMPQAWLTAGAAFILASVTFIVIRFMRPFPYLAVGWFWFMGTLVPVIGIAQVGLQAMADRYTYIPLIGLFIMVAWGLNQFSSRLRFRKAFLSATFTVVVSGCMILTCHQLQYWQNSVSLWEHAVNTTRNNMTAHNNLGLALTDRGKMDKAMFHFKEALKINPKDDKAYINLGYLFYKKGQFDEAITWSREALLINFKSSKAIGNIANALVKQGKIEEAISILNEGVRMNPDDAHMHYNLGNALMSQGKTDAALRQFREALRMNPHDVDAHNNLGNAFASLGNLDGAVYEFQEALRIDPGYVNAYINLGYALADQGKLEQSLTYFEKALQIKPDSAETHYNIGNILIALKRPEEAASHFKEAVRIKSDYAKAYNNLGSTLLILGKTDAAIANFREAVRLKPEYLSARANLRDALSRQKKNQK